MPEPSSASFPARIATHAVLLASCIAACIVIALIEGKDLNWDFRNYHLYGPWALVHLRYGMDFMAAGPQGYLNPVAYLPLYLLVTQGVDDRLVVAALAALHAFCPYFIWLIAGRLFADEPVPTRRALAGCSTVIAMLSPVVWGLVGGTFIDLTVTSFLLASLYVCLRDGDAGRKWIVAGLLFGIGAALKLTLLLFAPAIAVAVVIATGLRRPSGVAWFGLGALSGALVAGGASALAIYRAYGNPFFPLFNDVFQSDLAETAGTAAHSRFTPDSPLQFLTYPFRLLDVHHSVYVETSAPDARFAFLSLVLMIAVCGLIRRRRLVSSWCSRVIGDHTRARLQFYGFFVVAWACWLAASGNGRYGAVLFMLIGPCLVLVARSVLSPRVAKGGFALLVLAQSFLLSVSFDHRWGQVAWLGQWIEVEASPVDQSAHGYILAELNTNSVVFPFLNVGSGYFAIAGQVPQTRLPAVERRLQDFKQRWPHKLRLLMQGGRPLAERIPRSTVSLLALHGLRPVDVATRSCSTIQVSVAKSGEAARQTLLSCPLALARPDPELLEQQRSMQTVFDRVAASCRLWFPVGNDSPPVPRAAGWERRYEATDVVLFSYLDQIRLSRGMFGPFDVELGPIAEWKHGSAQEPECRPLPRHFDSSEAAFLK